MSSFVKGGVVIDGKFSVKSILNNKKKLNIYFNLQESTST